MRVDVMGDVEEALEGLAAQGMAVTPCGARSWVVAVSQRPLLTQVGGVAGIVAAGATFPLLGLRRSRFATVLLRESTSERWLEVEGDLARRVAAALRPRRVGEPAAAHDGEAAEEGVPASGHSGLGGFAGASYPVAPVAAPVPFQHVDAYDAAGGAPPPPPPAAPAPWRPPPAPYAEDHTVGIVRPSGSRFEPQRPVPMRAPTTAAPARLALAFDTGEQVVVATETRVGRQPPGASDVHTVDINDPEGSVSRFHFCLRPAQGGAWIEDNGSTNGTGILRDGSLHELRLGQPVQLLPGDVVVFGRRRAVVASA